MAGTVAYLDSSAFLKLVVAEDESAALVRALERWPERAAAALLRTEVSRALRRSGHQHSLPKARRMMRRIHLIQIDDQVLDRAGELEPIELRSLDAIHLAAALELGADLGVVVTYDLRLRAAAEGHGLEVVAPS